MGCPRWSAECTGLSRSSTRRYLEHLVSTGAEMRPRAPPGVQSAATVCADGAGALVVGPRGGAVVRPARGRSGGGQPVADGGQRGVPGREDVLLGELAARPSRSTRAVRIAWVLGEGGRAPLLDWFVKAR